MSTPFVFDPELIARYDRPGPRYTSYPPATAFYTIPPSVAYELYQESNRVSNPLSLYLHLPYCKEVCYFCACNTIFTKDRGRAKRYVDLLKQEIDLLSPLFSPDRKVVQLHLGGGTPTFLLPEDLHRLLSHLFSSFSVSLDGEISIELDPREVTEEHLSILREFSFNRYSIGVQDFDEKVQKAVHRIQPLDLTASLYEKIRNDPRTVSINLDLIYGLPYQTVTTFSKTLKEVLKLRPSRIALFNFAYLPSLKTHQRRIEVRALPPPQEKLRILALAVETLSDAGYRYIGMDHFALPEDELLKAQEEGTLYRNFQGYSTKKGCDLIGIGVTSIGEVMGNYLQNEKDEVSYREKVEKGILPTFRGFLPSLEDRLRKEIIMELMCHFRLDFSSFEERYLLSFSETFSRELELLRPMEEDGLLTIDPEGIEVTPFGRFLIRNIAMVFDTYSSLEKEPRFSRTI